MILIMMIMNTTSYHVYIYIYIYIYIVYMYMPQAKSRGADRVQRGLQHAGVLSVMITITTNQLTLTNG